MQNITDTELKLKRNVKLCRLLSDNLDNDI